MLPYGRRLPYPFSYVKALVQETGAFTSGDASQQQETNFYVICMTQEQQLRFTSALQAGYDLIYPDVWQQEMDLWLQSREFPNSVPPNCTIEFDMTLNGRLGMIFAWPDDTAPPGAIPCIGQTICGNDYPDFFAQDGISEWPGYSEFGTPPCEGFGSYTLPNLANRMIVGSGDEYGISTNGGVDEVSLTVPQLPPHSHAAKVAGAGGTGSFAFLNNLTNGTFGSSQPGFIQDTGAGDPHNNMPPYGAWLWCMWVEPEVIFEFGNPVSNVYSSDCVIFQNKNGDISQVVDVKACVVDATGGENVPGGEDSIEGDPFGDLDCVYGGAYKVAEYVTLNAVQLAETVQAGLNAVLAIFERFPNLTTPLIQSAVEFVEGTALDIYIADHKDPDYINDRACDLFCHILDTSIDPLYPLPQDFNGWIDGLFLDPLMYTTATGIGSGFMQKLFVLGGDECNDDWLLCDCVVEVEATVPGTTATPTSISLIAGASYIVSWSGTYKFGNPDNRSDGVYSYVGQPIQTFDATLQYFNGASWVGFAGVGTPYSDKGYIARLDDVPATLQVRISDSTYADNSGSLDLVLVPVT